MNFISIDDKWPTQDDIDDKGKIWVYRPPSMTKWDQTGMLFKILLVTYNEPLELSIRHFTNLNKQKLTKLDYTDSSKRAYNNRVQWPYWMPGYVLMEPSEKENTRVAIISADFPVVTGHVSRVEYDQLVDNNQTVHS